MKKHLILLFLAFLTSLISLGQKGNVKSVLKEVFDIVPVEGLKVGSSFGDTLSVKFDKLEYLNQRKSKFKQNSTGIQNERIINSDSQRFKNLIYGTTNDIWLSPSTGKSNKSTSGWVLNNSPSVVFPSANASGFFNEAKANVSNYTGQLNYSIPLYSLKSYDIELPISLSYNTTGAKTDEMATWVGLGWSLNAGGCITRVMKGLPDEYKGFINTIYGISLPAYGYLHLIDHPDYNIDIENFPPPQEELQKRFIRNASWENLDGIDNGDGLGNGEAWDTQGDEFYFNFPGYSGKFVFDQDGNILTIPHSNLRISKTLKEYTIEGVTVERIVKFDVITPDGYVYSFGDLNLDAVETTINLTLTRKVRYAYNPVGEAEVADKYGNWIDVYLYEREWCYLIPDPYGVGGIEQIEVLEYNPFPYSSSWYLKKITSPTTDEISFNYEQNEFLDFYVTKRGHNVVIPNLAELSPDIFYPIDTIFYIAPYGDNLPEWHKQEVTFFRTEVVHNTKLLSSIETNSGDRAEFITSLKLREDILGSKKLKAIKFFNQFDDPVKSFEFLYSYSQPEEYQEKDIFILGINPYNPPYAMSFEEYDDDVNDLLLQSEQKRLLLDYLIVYDKNNESNLPPYRFINNSGVRPRRAAYMTDMYGYSNDNNRGTNIRKIGYTNVLFDVSPFYPNVIDDFFIWYNYSYPVPSFYCQIANENEESAKQGILERIITPEAASIEFSYELNKIGSNNTSGLRVASIKAYPNVLDPFDFILTSYIYSGGEAVNTYRSRYSLPVNSKYHQGRNVHNFSNSVISQLFTQGGVVGYDNVKVQISSDGFNEFTYYNPSDISNEPSPVYQVGVSGSNTNTFPYPMDLDMDWKRGLMKTYNKTLNDGSKTTSENYSYNLDPDNFIKKYVFGLIGNIYTTDAGGYPNVFSNYFAGKYKYESGWFYNESETKKYYTSDSPGNESKAIITINDNIYDVKEHNSKQYTFLKETSTTMSNGKQIETSTQYPLDITNPSDVYMTQAVLDKMKDKNMLNSAITHSVFIENDKKEGAIISYDFQNGNDEFIKPVITRKYEGADYEIKTNFDKYDDFGNLLQFHKENDIYTSYYWGYNGQYPIIQADNIIYDELENVITTIQPDMESFLEDIGDMTMGTQRDDWESFNISLREALPNSLISTYTYEPLVGITSKTDGGGNTTYNNYDNFNRLQTTRDKDYLILEHIDYHHTRLIDINPRIYNLGSNSGSELVEISTDLDWNVTDNSEWISILPPSNGSGDGSFSFEYLANSEFGERSSLLTIESISPQYQTTIIVNQEADPFLIVEPTSIDVGFSQTNNIEILVKSNLIWSVEAQADWISVNPSGGQYSDYFNIQCEYNYGQARYTYVTVSADGVNTVSIYVYQDEHP